MMLSWHTMKNIFISADQQEIVTYLAGMENAGAKKG